MRAEQAPSSELPADRDTFAVVKTHSFEHDGKWVARLLAVEVAYLGLLGPRARSEKILAELRARASAGGCSRRWGSTWAPTAPSRWRSAWSSELLAVWSGRSPQHLRERNGGACMPAPERVAAVVLAAGSLDPDGAQQAAARGGRRDAGAAGGAGGPGGGARSR